MPLELGLTFGAMWLFLARTRGPIVPVIVLAAILLLLQAANWFGPVATEVTPGTSFTAFFAYGLATLAAWWLGTSRTLRLRRG